jgi:hypothetical protein
MEASNNSRAMDMVVVMTRLVPQSREMVAMVS